jgi:hypothetical protein
MFPEFSAKRMAANIVLGACIAGMLVFNDIYWRAACAIVLIFAMQIRDFLLIDAFTKKKI